VVARDPRNTGTLQCSVQIQPQPTLIETSARQLQHHKSEFDLSLVSSVDPTQSVWEYSNIVCGWVEQRLGAGAALVTSKIQLQMFLLLFLIITASVV
jgi:hypothetical protein